MRPKGALTHDRKHTDTFWDICTYLVATYTRVCVNVQYWNRRYLIFQGAEAPYLEGLQ